MRKLLSWLAVTAAVSVGCGGVSGPPEPKKIEGGGIADGPINGNLFVYVIDEETRAVLSSATVRVGDSSDSSPCEVVTDSTGLAKFQADNCAGLKGPATVTVTTAGYAPVTWIGVNGTNVTIPIRNSNPPAVPTATVSGTIFGWSTLPVPPLHHQTLALIAASQSDKLGDRANDLPQGTRNVVVGVQVFPIPSNLCVKNQVADDCNWTLTTRTGKQAHIALIVDQFDNNTPDDDTDDTFTFTGVAIKTGLDFAAGDTPTGESLPMLTDADMQTFTASFASLPSGMDYMGGFPALELGEEGRIAFILPALDMTHTTARVPKLTGSLAGAHYSLIAQAQDAKDQDRPSSLGWVHDANIGSTVALSTWLPPPSNILVSGGTYSFSKVTDATVQGAEIQNMMGQRVWSVTIFDGSTSFTLPGLSPDPLPAGTLAFEASAIRIPNTNVTNFKLDDARENIAAIAKDFVTFTH
ncbi:MAG TPA: hypothetical protein VN903_02455 [Polyangia bacterium]|jgi:hypothetical protein|nr:hypothetical protein [Polyangia bacterium]